MNLNFKFLAFFYIQVSYFTKKKMYILAMLKSESKKSSIKFPISAIKMLDSTQYSCKMFLGMVAEHFVNFVIHSLMCPIWDEKMRRLQLVT